MDEFLNIDWNPALEDILAGDFVNVERLQRDSVMYQTLRGTFDDPFTDLDKDYEHLVTRDMMSQVAEENQNQKEIAEAVYRPPSVEEKLTDEPPVEREYVPGIIISSLKFPKSSELTIEQQSLSLKILLRFSSSEKPVITAADKEELQNYMSLLPTISKEQDEFLEFAKENWDPTKFQIHEEAFINFQWKKKIQRIELLPRYYTETDNIPFVSSKEIGLNFDSTCLEMGTVPKIFVPKLTKRVLLPPNSTKINQRFFSSETNNGQQENIIFKIPVSQDRNCEVLAKEHNVDLVISSGGLNCIALNIDPNNTISWILPIVVKRINEKNVVFVDKPLPPTGLTVIQKNTWLHKYNLKSHITHPFHSKAPRLDGEEEKMQETSDLCMEMDQTNPINPCEENINKVDESREPPENKNEKNKFLHPPAGHNLFYRLFSIGSSDTEQNELMKNRVEKVYKLLVRSKIDGVMRAQKDEEQLTMIFPKLEHQLDLGAESVTMEEALKQWMSLTFRPDSSLFRMRIEATSFEYIQFEKRTATSVNNEIKRLYNLKTEAALTLLYNIAETMTGMNPGRYLMRHTVRNGAFASIYKETDGPGKNAFDLQTLYCEDEFRTIPNPPWPTIDKVVATPAQICFKRMPAMFRGKRWSTRDKKKNSEWMERGARGGSRRARGRRAAGRGGGRVTGRGRGQKKAEAGTSLDPK